MLKGLDPLLGPEVLFALAAMGHGDQIALVDANFPGAAIARVTAHGSLLRMDCTVIRALQAVLSVLPVDDFTDDAALTMQVVGDAAAIAEVQADAVPILRDAGAELTRIERFAFYQATRGAFAVIQTGEHRLYGNFILRKGVIRPS